MGAQVDEDDIDSLHPRIDPGLKLLEEGHDVGSRATLSGPGEHRAGVGLEGPKDVASSASTIVDLLRGALSGTRGHIDESLAREGLCRFRTHFVETDDDAARGWAGVKSLYCRLFAAKSGSTRSPNQFSCLRQ